MSKRMKKLKLYLETSVWNFLLAEDAPDKRQITEQFFEQLERGWHEIFISQLVIDEIERTLDPAKKGSLIDAVRNYAPRVLPGDPAIVYLADRFVAQAVIPKKKRDDAVHLAFAYFHEMDVLVSWNLRHIVKLNTRIKANAIARLEGYKPIEICTPEEVIDEGN